MQIEHLSQSQSQNILPQDFQQANALIDSIQPRDSNPTKLKVKLFKNRVFHLLKIYVQNTPNINKLIQSIKQQMFIRQPQKMKQLISTILNKQNITIDNLEQLLKYYQIILLYKSHKKSSNQLNNVSVDYVRIVKKISLINQDIVLDSIKKMFKKYTHNSQKIKQTLIQVCQTYMKDQKLRNAQKKQISKLLERLDKNNILIKKQHKQKQNNHKKQMKIKKQQNISQQDIEQQNDSNLIQIVKNKKLQNQIKQENPKVKQVTKQKLQKLQRIKANKKKRNKSQNKQKNNNQSQQRNNQNKQRNNQNKQGNNQNSSQNNHQNNHQNKQRSQQRNKPVNAFKKSYDKSNEKPRTNFNDRNRKPQENRQNNQMNNNKSQNNNKNSFKKPFNRPSNNSRPKNNSNKRFNKNK